MDAIVEEEIAELRKLGRVGGVPVIPRWNLLFLDLVRFIGGPLSSCAISEGILTK